MTEKRTKRSIPFATRGGLKFIIPKGARVEPATGQPGNWWVVPETFPVHSIERHDATYYGVTVRDDDVEETDNAAHHGGKPLEV